MIHGNRTEYTEFGALKLLPVIVYLSKIKNYVEFKWQSSVLPSLTRAILLLIFLAPLET